MPVHKCYSRCTALEEQKTRKIKTIKSRLKAKYFNNKYSNPRQGENKHGHGQWSHLSISPIT